MKPLDQKTMSVLLGRPTKLQKHDIDKKISECLEIANKQFPLGPPLPKGQVSEHAYTWPTVTFDLKGRTAGEAWASDIRLNIHLLHEFYDEMLNQTLPHEIAHCVVIQKYGYGAPSHGYDWKEVMRAFGLPPNRTHTMPTKAARVHPRPHRYVCHVCGKQWKLTNRMHNSIQSGRGRRCNRCKSPIYYADSEVEF
jgi:SprT protein